jgi:hypothetical protein
VSCLVALAEAESSMITRDKLFLNRPICFFQVFQRKRFRVKQMAGLKAFIWSNLCTRHIPNKLPPRGHEDWPDKRRRIVLSLPTRGDPELKSSCQLCEEDQSALNAV